MNKFTSDVLAIAIGLAFSVGAMAQTMSRDQYKSARWGLVTGYKSAMAACGSLSGNAKNICQAQASGKDKVAKAALKARYKPSEDASYKLRVARADADYAVAKEKCGALAGDAKIDCNKEAMTRFGKS